MAEAVAVELLMPLELRQHHLPAYRAGKLSDGELALRYWIPPYFVELAMSESYMEVVLDLRRDLVDISKPQDRRAAYLVSHRRVVVRGVAV